MPHQNQALRLDKYLFFTRLLTTRSAAADLCQSRRLRLDGRVIDKAHASVRVGSVISYPSCGAVISVRVQRLPERRGPYAEACTMYEHLLERTPPHKNRSGELSSTPKPAMPASADAQNARHDA